MPYTIDTIMTRCPVIPVIVINHIADALPMAEALIKGGLTVLEVTLRTKEGLQAIPEIRAAFPKAIIGAGTVVSPRDVQQALAAGAEFLVSPGSSPALIAEAKRHNIPFLPGTATPTEVMALLEQGFSHLKFFPAQAAGGVPMLKSIAGPLPQIRFCPTGGVTLDNARDYLALDNVLCVGGSWMLDAATIAARDWARVESGAREAAGLPRPQPSLLKQ